MRVILQSKRTGLQQSAPLAGTMSVVEDYANARQLGIAPKTVKFLIGILTKSSARVARKVPRSWTKLWRAMLDLP